MTASFLGEIILYPIKSVGGISVKQWPVVKTGLLYDRQWMLIDEHGQFLSQRKLPKMALIKTAIQDDQLMVSAPTMTDLSIALKPAEGEWLEANVWEYTGQARSVSAEVDQWFSQFLELPCRLVYHPEESLRSVDPDYALDTDSVAFSDGFPFLLVSENSLNVLNESAQLNLTMARFRPNLVVTGCKAYAEDAWREIRIAEIDFRLPKPCSRCSIPAIDPDTALIEKAPLTALNNTRKWQNKVYFGQNAIHNQTGFLSVGDEVHINKLGEQQPPL